mmetsp:Transcript_5005/g.18156  ORF Transcript_5005/g.18156 Transcript_5005/m.18156 type:complete len:230 (+) Transcript_5005:1178-1867(+)
MASKSTPALSAAALTGCRMRRRTSITSFSSNDRVIVRVSPPGIGISTLSWILSASRALRATLNAPLGSTSAPSFFASLESHCATARSKSSPPKFGSPPVARTSTVPLPTSSTLTSNVPPPRSNTNTVSSSSTSTPYAKAAATGSFKSRTVFNPAKRPASSVAAICLSSKYAGTVITALSTGTPKSTSAASNKVRSTCALTSSGSTTKSFPSPPTPHIAANFVFGCEITR